VWKQEIFRPNPCLYCDDVFAEVADIVLADAWLPSYIADSAGTTLAVVRSPNLQKLLEDGRGNNQIELVPLPIEDAIRSQCDFATSLVQKRRDLAARMAIFNGSFPLPKKRDFGFNPGVLDRIQAWLACRVRTAGRAAWAVQTDPKSYMDVQRNIKLTLQAHRLIRRLNALKRRVLHS
jgi:hypothetical protein